MSLRLGIVFVALSALAQENPAVTPGPAQARPILPAGVRAASHEQPALPPGPNAVPEKPTPTSETRGVSQERPALPTGSESLQPKPALTPETRGDIFMARKMYREAIDTFREGGSRDPILLNKIGIAYHQMMQLDNARKS